MGERVDYVVAGLGGLGSATAYELAKRGHSVVGLERFELGHANGASHDSSRILRHSYHTPAYVRLTQEAYDDWARLEHDTGTRLTTVVGGVDFFPPEPAISPTEYTESLDEVGIGYDLLDVEEVRRRWPQFHLPPGTVTLHQERSAIVHASRTTALLQQQAQHHGAEVRPHSPVLDVRALDSGEVEVTTPGGTISCKGLIVCADAWVNDVLRGLDLRLPIDVTLEQVTYFQPDRPTDFAPERMPLWIWMDDPSFYGFPTFGEPTLKAAEDCGGPVIDPDHRTNATNAAMQSLLAEHMQRLLPGSGGPIRSVRCQYTLTPDRDFVISAVPVLPQVVVGLGAAHGFKFVPTFGRLLADLACRHETTTDLTAFRWDRPALTDTDYQAHWLV